METLRPNGSPDHVRPGLVPTEDDHFWVAAMRDVIAGATRSSQWAALAIGAASLFGLTALLATRILVGPPGILTQVLWIVPLLLWSASLVWSARVFGIRRYRFFANSPDSSRQAIIRIARRKADQLYWATGFWAAGMLTAVIALIHDAVSAG
jgi:hypothetical protein